MAKMKFEVIDGCPVPADVADAVREIKRRSGARLNSCYRGHDARAILRANGKMSQTELYDGWRKKKKGFNPANAPGQSTHECRNDGAAYPGGVGEPLAGWQVGMDWSDPNAAIQSAKELGYTAAVTYPNSSSEGHHLNFQANPVRPFPLLRKGDAGTRVELLTQRLAFVYDPQMHKPYLKKKQSVFTEGVRRALIEFQHDHSQMEDGIYGRLTHRQLLEAVRRRKRHLKRKAEAKRITRDLSKVLDKKGKPYWDAGEKSVLTPDAIHALRRFQRDQGCAVDGAWGPQTKEALDREVRRSKKEAKLISRHLSKLRDKRGKPYYQGGEIAVLTPQAIRALKRFQADHGCVADGIWGPQTQQAVHRAKGKGKPPRKPGRPGTSKHVSEAGIDLIVEFEGMRLEPYTCPAGHATIGIGHKLHDGPVTKADQKKYAGYTEKMAKDQLAKDVRKFEQAVLEAVKTPLTQQQFDSCVSLAFNIGPGAFTSSTLCRKLNAEDYEGAAEEFPKWKYGSGKKVLPGLVQRRKAERDHFIRN